MFSTVMLHWYVYRDGKDHKREMPFEAWKRLNAGLEEGGRDVPEHVQQKIHARVGQAFIPQLAVATCDGGGPGGCPTRSHNVPTREHPANSDARLRTAILSPHAAVEGWLQIVGGGFPRPQGLDGVRTVTYKHVSSIFSEVTHNPSMRVGSHFSPAGVINGDAALGGRQSSAAETAVPAPWSASPMLGQHGGSTPSLFGPRRDDHAWVSLCYTLLFFSVTSHGSVPYAFVELPKVVLASVDEGNRVLTLVGAPEVDGDEGGDCVAQSRYLDGGGGPSCQGSSSPSAAFPVSVVLLLPDGRWQELSLPKLDLHVPSGFELQGWSTHLQAACQGRSQRSLTPQTASAPPVGSAKIVAGSGGARLK